MGVKNDGFLSVREMAHYLRCSPNTVRTLAKRGELETFRAGKKFLRVRLPKKGVGHGEAVHD